MSKFYTDNEIAYFRSAFPEGTEISVNSENWHTFRSVLRGLDDSAVRQLASAAIPWLSVQAQIVLDERLAESEKRI